MPAPTTCGAPGRRLGGREGAPRVAWVGGAAGAEGDGDLRPAPPSGRQAPAAQRPAVHAAHGSAETPSHFWLCPRLTARSRGAELARAASASCSRTAGPAGSRGHDGQPVLGGQGHLQIRTRGDLLVNKGRSHPDRLIPAGQKPTGRETRRLRMRQLPPAQAGLAGGARSPPSEAGPPGQRRLPWSPAEGTPVWRTVLPCPIPSLRSRLPPRLGQSLPEGPTSHWLPRCRAWAEARARVSGPTP